MRGKEGLSKSKLKLSLPPSDDTSFAKFLTQSGTFKEGDLLVNKDGVRIIPQKDDEATPPIKPLDNQLNIADIDIIKVIGKGSSGIVQLVRHKWTGQFFALKATQVNFQESFVKQIKQELKISQYTQCPYVVVCYQSFYDNGVISLILEYMNGGSLADFLKKVKSIPEPYLAAICKQVLKGLMYLHHDKHIIHRDLKPSNLLINHSGEVKITDFGGMNAILTTSSAERNSFVGTYTYMSPERISGGTYSYKSDIWSLGVVLLECATGRFPYVPKEQQEGWDNCYELLEAIVDEPSPFAACDQHSPEFCSFISACLQKDPKDRKAAHELMQYPFISLYEDLDVNLASYFTDAGSPLATFGTPIWTQSGTFKEGDLLVNKDGVRIIPQKDDEAVFSAITEQVVVKPQSIEIIAAEVDKNLHKDDDQHEQSKRPEEVGVRLQSIEIIASEVDKNFQKDDDQHEPRKHTKEVAVRPRSINIIAANMYKNLQEIASSPQSLEIFEAEMDKNLHKGRCLGGFFPENCWRSNYKKKLGKLVAQKKMRKVEVKQKSLGMAGYMFEKAWSLLGEDDDDEIRIMGLYGQGGVGKTTLLKQINNEFIKSRYQRGLDIVILVLVSKPIKVEMIQKKIGESLKLSLEGNESKRAEEIFKVLRNKNFVLLLDDIWERIDLQCIGVPRPQGKSKIIFTTRSKIVCGLMEADKTFKVECLPWNKAWSLFQENVGEEALNSDLRVPELAKIIAGECAGLPLALITIGRAMSSKKSLQEWNDTITTLREFESGCSGICDEGFSHLKLSYDNLHSETIKSCFLYCSLYPEHHSIPKSQLIDFWIGQGIFQWVDDIDEIRNRAYDTIENLKGAFLLESGEDEETSVKMHDVIRDLALWIVNEFGRRKDKSLVERATGIPNTSDKWENAERIYLSVDINTKEEEEEEEEEIQNDIQMETPPRSPNLLTLMVHGNSYYADLFLTQNFFQFMPLLRVLDFSELEMEEFPTSITELIELQYLGLAKTNIEALPDELRKLAKLKYLDLSHTYFLKKIPPGVIASLSELRVFNQYHSDFGDWDEDGPSLRELTSLRHLDDLGITIETVLALQRLLRNRKLRMCTRHLTINECINLKSLALSSTTTTLSLGNLKRLKDLACQNCSALAELTMNWAVVEDGQKGLLSNLETLTLWNLPRLNVVWEKQYVCSSFQNLKKISIIGCNALKDLTWLVYVRNLETLYLRKCQEVEEILDVDAFGIGGDEMLTRDVVFKELKNIYMGNLVRLERICKHALAFPSLKSMVVEDCPHLKKLPLDCDSNVNNTLQRIEGGATWWNQLYWEDDQVKSKFLPYFEE